MSCRIHFYFIPSHLFISSLVIFYFIPHHLLYTLISGFMFTYLVLISLNIIIVYILAILPPGQDIKYLYTFNLSLAKYFEQTFSHFLIKYSQGFFQFNNTSFLPSPSSKGCQSEFQYF